MHSLKTSVFALAKPHDSVGKRTRNRIPKEERKILVESFIKKHQKINNGSFPSLSLTHKEVGGSFYTIREIVREIIQENRVLGAGDGDGDEFSLEGNGSSSVMMDPVPPFFFASLDQNYNFTSEVGNGEHINGSAVVSQGEGLILDQSVVTTDLSSMAHFESDGIEHVNDDDASVNDVGAVMTQVADMTENTLGTVGLPAETVVDAFPVGSVTSAMESSEVELSDKDKVCEEETGSSITTSVDLEEVTESNATQMPNHISVLTEKKVEEKTVNHTPIDVKCAGTEGTVGVNATTGNILETKGYTNGSLTTPVSETESGSCKNDIANVESMSSHAKNEVTNVEKAATEQQKLDASDSSSSEKANTATLNRIKPKSWKGESNKEAHETNPLLAVLKSFLTAFVKFWSE